MSNFKRAGAAIQTGNAQLDGSDTRGWFIGDFLPPECGLRRSEAVEIKWGTHPAGEARTEWVTSETRTTVGILISGKFALEFRNKSITLVEPGDYVMWGSGIDHKWQAITDCIFLTVRWPSADSGDAAS